jgi:hypothetical protein
LESESESLYVLFLLLELSAMVQKLSLAKQQPAQVLGRLPTLATITFIFTAA